MISFGPGRAPYTYSFARIGAEIANVFVDANRRRNRKRIRELWIIAETGNAFVRASRCRNRKHIRPREPLPKQKCVRFREQVPESETLLFARIGSETGNVSVRANRSRNRKRIRSREPVPKSDTHQSHIHDYIYIYTYIYTYIYIYTCLQYIIYKYLYI